ncbi:GerAB/ArcD/ProY family transporter [Alicyclobacillus ferrooxydans]|uniref:Uncharacterized protein n=1 Tax=Alicyclobacillus ferrooxydans TaxID=471514 RepID=A0A0P9CQW9_9BACL|nr:endospore germination permease [Alicyclobacillus ferrooxydans]KPV45266.1 hypothetical protein AN477_02390 [Alicyclobacillus ferrooxydans]
MGDKLTRLETIYLSVWSVMGTGILAIPFAIGQFTIRDGWLSVTVVLFTGLSIILVAIIHNRCFPQQSVMQGLTLSFGRIFGRAFGLWYALCLYLIAATVWRELIVFLEVTVYPKTALSLLAAVLVFPIFYGLHKGIKSVGLFSDFLAPLAVVVSAVFVILSMEDVQLSSLRPILTDGLTPVLRGAVVPGITYVLEPLVILQLVQDLNRSKSLPWDFAIVVALVFCFLLALEVVSIGVLGGAIAGLRYPILEVIRVIKISEFIERLDTLYVMAVLASIYIKLAVFIYAFCKAMEELFGLSSQKVVIWPATLLVWAGSMFLFKDVDSMGQFIILTTPAYFIFTFVVLPVLSAGVYRFFHPKPHETS